jgi:hypothetical protein
MTPRRWHLSASLCALLAAGLAACHDTAAPVASSLSIVSGNNQTLAVGTASLTPLVVGVVDQNGDPMDGVSVAWSVAAGDGQLSATSSVTNSAGQASVSFTAGSTAGVDSVTAKIDGLAAVAFTISVTDPASTSTVASRALRLPPVVITARTLRPVQSATE